MSNAKMYQNSRTVGNIGEAIALAEFVKRGIPVFTPFGQNNPVDMIAYINEKFVKIQVKTTEIIQNGAMEFDISRTNGFTGRRKTYAKNEVDYFFLYCVENDYKGWVSFEELGSRYNLYIRCTECKSGRKKGVNKMEDFRFEDKIKLLLGTV